jgi:hypothetical protein
MCSTEPDATDPEARGSVATAHNMLIDITDPDKPRYMDLTAQLEGIAGIGGPLQSQGGMVCTNLRPAP